MPVVTFANPKGGSGKTTSALLLASELAGSGRAKVTVIDADPERWISKWAELPGCPDNLRIVSDVTEESIIDRIEEAAQYSQFVIVDLEGTASLMGAHAVSMSDLVLIPLQGASMDARGGAKTIKLIRNQERTTRREIPHAVLLTRTSAAVMSRALRNVRDQLDKGGIEVLSTAIVERAAYRDMFDYGGLLSAQDPALVSNLDNAVKNAREFAGEIVTRLRRSQSKAKVA